MTIQEILEAHQGTAAQFCATCTDYRPTQEELDAVQSLEDERRLAQRHQAEVLKKHMQERMAHERAHTIQMIRDQSDWTQDETDEYGRVTLEGYLTIGTRELDKIEDGAGADRMCFSLADWEKREEQVRAEAKQEALNEAATKLEDTSVSPIWCWDKCGDPKCPDDIRVGAATEIQKWLRGRANQYKETR